MLGIYRRKKVKIGIKKEGKGGKEEEKEVKQKDWFGLLEPKKCRGGNANSARSRIIAQNTIPHRSATKWL